MKIDIRLPSVTAEDAEGQLRQLRSYMYRLAEQVQWALNTLDEEARGSSTGSVVQASGQAMTPAAVEAQTAALFPALKSLIIRSAEIMEACGMEVERLLDRQGKYTAEATFGDGGAARYIAEMRQTIEANSRYLEQNFYKKETIDAMSGTLGELREAQREQSGYIRYGEVGSWMDSSAIGIEIGELDAEGGTTEQRYARFTSGGLELFGEDKAVPVAYVCQTKLYITSAEVSGSLQVGGFLLDSANGLAFKWVGRN